MKLIAGLGNPGARYELTRHNIGFIILDLFASQLGIRFREGKGDWHEAHGKINGEEVVLLKPVSFMNNSGMVIKDFLERNRVNKEELLVVTDDFQLPLGTVRIRKSGSDGGHNGIASIIYELETQEFPRMRVGIGKETPLLKDEHIDFVLNEFNGKEIETLKYLVPHYIDCIESFVINGVNSTMNNFNKSFLETGAENSDNKDKDIKKI